MEQERCGRAVSKIRVEQSSIVGGVWFASWLFTIGYLHLSFWRGVLAVVLWPYYIGVHVSGLVK